MVFVPLAPLCAELSETIAVVSRISFVAVAVIFSVIISSSDVVTAVVTIGDGDV